MIVVIAISAALTMGLLVLLAAELIPSRSPAVSRRVSEVAAINAPEVALRRRRQRQQKEHLRELLERLGQSVRSQSVDTEIARSALLHAGYRHPDAAKIYTGWRILLAAVLGGSAALILPVAGVGAALVLLAIVYMAFIGYVAPPLYIRRRVRSRQKEITLALPDTLDLLVVCVEAGLGLNQAFVRVADEIHQLSEVTATEFHLMNLEIRAGKPRDQALRNLFERTGVEDLRSLTVMLIQADRFGTSIANALRVHAETVRDKRRQRAEEAAAKTTIKIVFPLVLCILPALFIVLIGPALLQIVEALQGLSS